MDDIDQPGEWLPVPEAAARLRTTEGGVRNRIKRNSLRHRRGNDGKVLVLVPPADQPATNGRLSTGETVALLRQARDEAEAWRRQAEERGAALAEARAEVRVLREGMEQEARVLREGLTREREIAAQAHEALMREVVRGERLEAALERAQVHADRIEAELAALRRQRRPWWRKLLG